MRLVREIVLAKLAALAGLGVGDGIQHLDPLEDDLIFVMMSWVKEMVMFIMFDSLWDLLV
jgi:hypothetical protein